MIPKVLALSAIVLATRISVSHCKLNPSKLPPMHKLPKYMKMFLATPTCEEGMACRRILHRKNRDWELNLCQCPVAKRCPRQFSHTFPDDTKQTYHYCEATTFPTCKRGQINIHQRGKTIKHFCKCPRPFTTLNYDWEPEEDEERLICDRLRPCRGTGLVNVKWPVPRSIRDYKVAQWNGTVRVCGENVRLGHRSRNINFCKCAAADELCALDEAVALRKRDTLKRAAYCVKKPPPPPV